MSALVLFLPDRADAVWRWLRLSGGRVAARGEGMETLPKPDPEAPEPDRLVAVAPAGAVTLDWAELPDLAPAQARAAARLLASENCIQPVGSIHVALGEADGDGTARPMATVDMGLMTLWLSALQARGLDPDAVLPSPLLLPRPDSGFVRADLGGETVLRGPDSGFADDPALTPLLAGEAETVALGREALEESIAAAVARPPLDLRQGPFARRRRWAIDWRHVRQLALLAGGVALVTLAISLVLILRYSLAADALERRAETVAAQALPGGAGQGNPIARLDERLASVRGGGYGFSATAGAIFAAVEAVPGTDLNAMTFERDGTAKLTITAATAPEVETVKARLEAMGLRVVPSVFQPANGRISGDLTVSPR